MKVLFLLTLGASLQIGVESKVFNRRSDSCDYLHALHQLESLSASGTAFCTSLLHSTKAPTKTESSTATKTQTCSVRTVTTTEHGTLTTFTFSPTITLAQLTKTEYSSSVLIPSGKSRPINKRSVAPAGPKTPSAISTCLPASVARACSSLLGPTTTTATSTTTKSLHTCLSTTTVTFTTTRHTTTIKFPLTVTPPPVIVGGTGVLTTTVPADCVSSAYGINGAFPPGDIDGSPQYPDQPRSLVECCVACHHTENCVALAYDPDADDCAFLLQNTTSSTLGVSQICPFGLQDFAFPPKGELDSPDPNSGILPGPCGF